MGINDIQMPCTPERVWKAIQSAGSNQADATTADAQPHFDADAPNQDTPDPSALDERSRPVIPASFDYLAPTSVADALAALAEAGDDAKVLAGGQSLLPILRMRLNAPGAGHRPRQDRGAPRASPRTATTSSSAR